MKTRILAILAVLTALVAANLTGVTAANAATSGCYTYSVNGGNATITDGTACSGVVIVPSTLGGFPVTEIGIRAFNHDRDITSISLPNSVTGTGVLVFQDATALKSISFGSGLTVISEGILGDDPALESVFLPTSLQRIDGYAFFNCQNLKEITIPASVISIETQAFYSNANLNQVSIAAGSQLSKIANDAFFGTAVSLSAPTRVGFNFTGWNTASNGLGTSYSGAALNSYLAAGSATIYSQWAPLGESLTYDGNQNLGGAEPVDASSPYVSGSKVTVRGNTGSLTKTGFSFAGWNTAVDGSGDAYASGSTLTMAESAVVLYAQWTPEGNTLTYDGNGSLSGPAPIDHARYLYASAAPIRDQWRLIDKPGYKFTGWNTEPDGTGRPATPGALFVMLDAPVVLYAQWAPVGNAFSYNGNDSDGGLLPSFVTSPLVSGSHVVVQNNSGTLTKNGFTFAGWNTAADGTGTAYAPGALFDMPETAVVLYAQWQLTPVKATWSTAPTITGIAKATSRGKYSLTSNSGIWLGTPAQIVSRQWYACTAKVSAATSVIPKTCKVIRGATSATLALKTAQKKKYIAVAVTAQSAGTTATTVLSKSSGKVK